MSIRLAGLAALLLASALLPACGSSEPPPPPKDEHKALQRAIQEPIDRARAVEGQLQEQQKARQRQLDAQEQ
ncbi:MAG TPA: hypothetical protein PLI44_02890 [Chiayiivirga sp.]|jgi:hypothetical protein|uniref:Lipoprotein n=1 Tax=Denitratimonas tolerans TaxID=1338420 RepID=A0AAW9R759_9GAMM|nr:hypothetical protein [Xanthomonadaceae bacterium]MDX9765226.1 hypothetical protein [Chiayiivirga sp.]HMN34322.1 hypothetical protein [Chiayiivirga sp.]HRN59180.1 hypothetical protein [Chiayiivirga sp.]HRO88165.1 hypothetical protein [Chiayiivirga sp.]